MPLLLVAALSVAAAPTAALTFGQAHAQARGRNIAGLTFALDLSKTRFHRGEIIPVTLRFWREPPGAYKLDTRLHDRSGRSHFETYVVDRPGDVPDPLAAYFREGGIRGGLSSGPQPLGPQPQLLPQTLSEFLRFDRPGRYRVYALSKRVFPAEKEHASELGPQTPVASEVAEFEILPGEAWAENRSREIEALLEAPAPDTIFEERDRSLARELRFLDTPLSRRLAIRYFDDSRAGFSNDLFFGLISSRDLADVARAGREHIASPGGAVSGGLLRALEHVEFEASSPPTLPRQASGAGREAWDAAHRARDERRKSVRLALLQTLHEAAKSKSGAALGVTLATLLENAPTPTRHAPLSPSQAREAADLRRLVIANWNSVPRREQESLLRYRWPLARDTSLLPILRRELDEPEATGEASRNDYERRHWIGLLLRRLTDLSPSEGLKYLRRELALPTPRASLSVLLDGPDEVLPALQNAWLGRLRDPKTDYTACEDLAALVARYATPDAADAVEVLLRERGDGGDEARNRLLAALTRLRPSRGAALIEAEVKGRSRRRIFEPIAAFEMNAPLEAVAVKYLWDADLSLAGDAARALSRAGSRAAEAALWKRLEAWGAARGKRAAQNDEKYFEESLAWALSRMPGPLGNAAAWARARSLMSPPAWSVGASDFGGLTRSAA